jgi:sugar phosphate isomerase/epimerase
MTSIITVQEQHLPGTSLEEKFEIALEWGYGGIELRAAGDLRFERRLPELRRAAKNGVVMPTVCVEMSHFIGDFNEDLRKDAITQLSSQLSVMGELGGRGAMTPHSYGLFSKRLPPFVPPRSDEESTALLIDALTQLGARAETEGVELYLEPLNRYEDFMINKLADAAAVIQAVGMDSVKIVADTYHMNIEERDLAQAFQDVAPFIGHVQASDSNRFEPGAGHIDWALFGATMKSIGYTAPVAVESRLSGNAEDVLPRASTLLSRYL